MTGSLFDLAPAALARPNPAPGDTPRAPRLSRGRRVWRQLAAAADYDREVTMGYIALPVIQKRRADICRACPMASRHKSRFLGDRTFWFCGPRPGDERMNAERVADRYCGCMVLEGTEGTDHDPIDTAVAAARTVCSRYECPQGLWGQDLDDGRPRRVPVRVRRTARTR